MWTSLTDTRIVDAFTTLGFEPNRHSYRMEIDLGEEPQAPAWPDGITVRTRRATTTGASTRR